VKYEIFKKIHEELNKQTGFPFYEVVRKETPRPYGAFGETRQQTLNRYVDGETLQIDQTIFFFTSGRTREEAFNGAHQIVKALDDLEIKGINTILATCETKVDEYNDGDTYAQIQFSLKLQIMEALL